MCRSKLLHYHNFDIQNEPEKTFQHSKFKTRQQRRTYDSKALKAGHASFRGKTLSAANNLQPRQNQKRNRIKGFTHHCEELPMDDGG